MVWPLLKKNDVFSLCEPFTAVNMSTCMQQFGFAGFIFFDVGSVLIDLDWESFFEGIKSLAQPSHQFSLEKFLNLHAEAGLKKNWALGKLSTLAYVKKL